MSSERVTGTRLLRGTLDHLGMPYSVDFNGAFLDAHTYAVEKLLEKFGPKGRCTLLDYVLFYGEYLEDNNIHPEEAEG
ncbi:unnamed protein product [marine sediment metagenome]|uniref:Uncharacterized protein n=1 Tax=marine sediment metagenome TaxID=412755 RepID=X1BY74_9ZZZZ